MIASPSIKNTKMAQKIVREWLSAAARHERNAQSGLAVDRIKKIHEVQRMSTIGRPIRDLPDLHVLRDHQKWAVTVLNWSRRSHAEFEKWCAKGPDSGMASIGSQLKLGGPKSPAYIAVRDNLKKPLRDLEVSIREIRASWSAVIGLFEELTRMLEVLVRVVEEDEKARAKGREPKAPRRSGLAMDILRYVRRTAWLRGL